MRGARAGLLTCSRAWWPPCGNVQGACSSPPSCTLPHRAGFPGVEKEYDMGEACAQPSHQAAWPRCRVHVHRSVCLTTCVHHHLLAPSSACTTATCCSCASACSHAVPGAGGARQGAGGHELRLGAVHAAVRRRRRCCTCQLRNRAQPLFLALSAASPTTQPSPADLISFPQVRPLGAFQRRGGRRLQRINAPAGAHVLRGGWHDAARARAR